MDTHMVINHDANGLIRDMLQARNRKVLAALQRALHRAYKSDGWEGVRRAILMIVESPLGASGDAVKCLTGGLAVTIEQVRTVDAAVESHRKAGG